MNPELDSDDIVLDIGETVEDAAVADEVDDDPDTFAGEEVDDLDVYPADDDEDDE